jgi:peptide/nickel transport system ATP-binding protein
MSRENVMLAIEGLHIDLPSAGGWSRVVRGVDLAVEAGEIVAIVGESGSGKSLTALSIMNLLPRGAKRRAERLSFANRDLSSLSARQMEDLRGREIGMIFQDPAASFNPTLTIGRQLEEVHIRHCRKGRQVARDRAVELMEMVGMPAAATRLSQYPSQLSGGLRQRAMIAMALMCEPSLLIADEPTTALDVTVQAQVLKLLDELRRRTGIAIMLITHDLGVVASVADRVAVMYAGEIVETGRTRDVLTTPRHPYTQGLFACIPRIGTGTDIRPGAPKLPTIPGRIPDRVNLAAGCIFADRCNHVMDPCWAEDIPLLARSSGHADRCMRTAEMQVVHHG